jgi:hypothetical protein
LVQQAVHHEFEPEHAETVEDMVRNLLPRRRPSGLEALQARLPAGYTAMARKPENVVARLSVPERVLLFCVASGTEWGEASGPLWAEICDRADRVRADRP